MNCGGPANKVEPYVCVGLHIKEDHLPNISRLLEGFPSRHRELTWNHQKEILKALYRLYTILEFRDEDQAIICDFLIIRRPSIEKYGHTVSCLKAVRSLRIRMSALTEGREHGVFISDGSKGSENDNPCFRLAYVYASYIRNFYLSLYDSYLPLFNLRKSGGTVDKSVLNRIDLIPPFLIRELMERKNE